MRCVSFGSRFEVEEMSKKLFAHKTGKSMNEITEIFKKVASESAGSEDKFVLASVPDNVNGQLLPAILRYIPSADSKGIRQTAALISNKRYWGSEIVDFMSNIAKEWSKSN